MSDLLPLTSQETPRFTARLLIACADRPGIVAAVSGFLFQRGANIVSSHQYSSDPTGGRFFLRTEFFLEMPSGGRRSGGASDAQGHAGEGPADAREHLERDFDAAVGRRFEMDWEIRWWGE